MKKFAAMLMAIAMLLSACALAEETAAVTSPVASPVASPIADLVGDPADLPEMLDVMNGVLEIYLPETQQSLLLNAALEEAFGEGAAATEFAVIDVDGDGRLDMLLKVDMNGEDFGTMILSKANDKINGYPYTYRAMMNVKEDATFDFSSGAADSGVGSFSKDEEGNGVINVLAESVSDGEGNITYTVNGETADVDAFDAVIDAQRAKTDLTFVEATAANLLLYLTIE